MRLIGEKELILVDSLVVNPILQAANTKRTPFEIQSLKDEIRDAGRVTNPFLVWKLNNENVIVDGYTRCPIVKELHLEDPDKFPPLVEVEWCEFSSIEEAVYWIGIHQGNYRQRTPEEEAYYNGKLYDDFRDKAKLNAFLLAKGRSEVKNPNVAELLGDIQNKSKQYLLRAHKFFLGIEKIKAGNSELADAILKKHVSDEGLEVQKITMEMIQKFSEINNKKAVSSIEDIIQVLAHKEERTKKTRSLPVKGDEKENSTPIVWTDGKSLTKEAAVPVTQKVEETPVILKSLPVKEADAVSKGSKEEPVREITSETVSRPIEAKPAKESRTTKRVYVQSQFNTFITNPTRQSLDVLIKEMESLLAEEQKGENIAA